MATLPVAGYVSSAARNVGEMKVQLEDLIAAMKQIVGSGVAEADLTIASGSITPQAGANDTGTFLAVDTEAAAANDDLTNITVTNLPDGTIICLHPKNAARTLTVKHNAGGSGLILLRSGGDLTLGATNHYLWLRRRGTTWEEMVRVPREGVVGINAKSGAYTVTENDRGKLIDCNGVFTVTLLPVARAGVGFDLYIRNQGTQLVTLDGNASETIDGVLTLKLWPGHEVSLACTGSEWKTVSRYANFIPAGHLWGLTLSNSGGDPTNDIDVAAGECASMNTIASDRVLLSLGSAITKRLDATWAAGTNQGGRSSSTTLTNGTYYVHAIRVNGVDDIGFDTSQNGINLIADHGATHVRYLGAILRESAVNVPFVQDGDHFMRKASVLSIDVTAPGTSAVLRTLHVPIGLTVLAIVQYRSDDPTNANIIETHFSDPALNDEAASPTAAPLGSSGSYPGAVGVGGLNRLMIRTNTAAQIRSRVQASSATSVLKIATLGWIDTRRRTN